MSGTPASTRYKDIPGWFGEMDRRVFSALLDSQDDSPPGDLVEIGVFMGKSAVIMADFLRDEERFVVIDLFGDMSALTDSESDEANRRENTRSYKNLNRQRFEEHYLSAQPELPTVVQGLSSEIVKHVEPQSARFIHVDASHMYAGVSADCQSTKRLLRPGGIAAFDDYRNAKCPGVAAAVWEAVFKDGLIPVATTPKKMYGVYDDPEPYAAALRKMVEADPTWFVFEEHDALGRKILRLDRKVTAAKPASKKARRPGVRPSAAAPPRAKKATAPRKKRPAPTTLRGRITHRIARDVAPPALTRWVRRRRRGR